MKSILKSIKMKRLMGLKVYKDALAIDFSICVKRKEKKKKVYKDGFKSINSLEWWSVVVSVR